MKLLRIISTIAFSLLVLISSSSFMVSFHFCSGNVQDVALFTKANSCAKEKQMPPCIKHEANSCCEDQTIIHEGQDIKSDAFKLQLSAIPVIDIEQSFALISEVIPSAPFSRIKYYNYDSPLRSTDLTISYLVFLI